MDKITSATQSLTSFIGNTLANLFLTMAVTAFLYSVVSFIIKRAKGADGNVINDARNQLGWSIIGLFVMFSIWGIIAFLQSGFGIDPTKNQITAPSIKTEGGLKEAAKKKKGGELCSAPSECESNQCKRYGDPAGDFRSICE